MWAAARVLGGEVQKADGGERGTSWKTRRLMVMVMVGVDTRIPSVDEKCLLFDSPSPRMGWSTAKMCYGRHIPVLCSSSSHRLPT